MSKPALTDPILLTLQVAIGEKLGDLTDIQPQPPERYFQELSESIIGQQLSTKVAETITQRVRTLVGPAFTPERILAISEEEFRQVGMSYAKARYVRAVAEAWQSGLIEPSKIASMDDETLITHLTQIKGVGRWTAEMFLIFTIGRTDVFSVGDYGLRKAIAQAYQLPMETKPAELLKLSETWKPHRSLASRILWKSLELT